MPDLVRFEPIALLPTQAGCAVFLGDGMKTVVIYIDPSVGMAINNQLGNHKPPRPLTHDLFAQTLDAFGAKVQRVVIVSCHNEVYHARLIIEACNEVMQRKIVEIDSRPSDGMALALRHEAPMYMIRSLWESMPDVTETLRQMQQQSQDDDADA